MRILDQIPHLTAASVSVLEPGTKINPHFGDTNAIARVHLGLSIPGEAPDCALQVGDEIRSWQEGKINIFTDAHFHMAWNYTDQRRIILILDVMRPEFVSRTKPVCAHVLGSICLLSLFDIFPPLKNSPNRIKRLCMALLQPAMRIYLALRSRLNL
jgi:aspartyl/asparaginyl beta-hydroxylase (cupin superfamily)